MYILKNGRDIEIERPIKFDCPKCDCQFILSNNEYHAHMIIQEPSYISTIHFLGICPQCHNSSRLTKHGFNDEIDDWMEEQGRMCRKLIRNEVRT